MTPSSHTDVSAEIARSWSGIRSNYIVVAPPLTEPEIVFRLLRDPQFLEDHGATVERLAIAWLPITSYGTSAQFIARIRGQWNARATRVHAEYLDALEDAIEGVVDSARKPVVLLPQFHKAIERLSWDLGSKLRNLEVDYGLRTVIELPVPLGRLRDRWEVLEGKETFISSDFGQGHCSVVLRGFTDEEVLNLARQEGLREEWGQEIMRLSGGLPGLVHWLLQESRRSNSLEDLRARARHGAAEQCKRFVDWLDAPNELAFKRRLADVKLGVANPQERAWIADHEWRSILVDGAGNLRAGVIGFACIQSAFEGNLKRALSAVRTAVREGRVEEALSLCENSPEPLAREKLWPLLQQLVLVLSMARGLSPNWEKVRRGVDQAARQAKRVRGSDGERLTRDLEAWKNLSLGARRCERLLEERGQGWRLSDCLCGRDRALNVTDVAVGIISYRLKQAGAVADPTAAMKSVLEIPEQTLQVYCAHKLGITVWAAPEFDEETLQGVRAIWKAGPYVAPKVGSRLGFVDLLHIGWVRMSKLEEQERLFSAEDEISYWSRSYEALRNPSSHSITFVKEDQWREYQHRCQRLAARLALVLLGRSVDDIAPSLEADTDLVVGRMLEGDRGAAR